MLYLDSSALIKRYLKEEGSDSVIAAMDAEGAWCSCRIGFLETARAVGRAEGARVLKEVELDWREFDVIEVDRDLTERAVEVAIANGLRSLDALHLAAALSLSNGELVFATWDKRLHRAARAHGLRTLPARLG
jgi:predicted nucleic acid-binding protein